MGGKFPMPVCYYNTQLDTGRSPPFFSQNFISVSICFICILFQKWWNCWAEIPLFLEQKVVDVCSQLLFIFENMLEFVLIVYFLLDWLAFWAEVHLVQEEIDLFQKTELLQI